MGVQTIPGHRSEIWTTTISPDMSRLVTGSTDRQIRMWTLEGRGTGTVEERKERKDSISNHNMEEEEEDQESKIGFEKAKGEDWGSEESDNPVGDYMGSILREGNEKCLSIQ